jgi:hypothetical protein
MDHRVDVLANVRNAKPQYAIPFAFQPPLAYSILLPAAGQPMNAAVDLNDDPSFQASEINNIAADPSLPAKLGTRDLAVAQPLPQAAFFKRRVAAHAPRLR